MKTLNYAKILLFFMFLLGLTSCKKYYDDEYLQNSDSKLCGYTWVIETETSEEKVTHSLKFDKKRNGQEVYETKRKNEKNEWVLVTTNSFYFSWSWISNMEGILIEYGSGDRTFFENVWVREYYLSGTFDGEDLLFRRADKH